MRRELIHRPRMCGPLVHDAQRALDDLVALKSPPDGRARVLSRKPGFEHGGKQQIEQPIKDDGLARLVFDDLVTE